MRFDDKRLERLYYESDYRDPQLGPDITKQFRKKVGLLEGATNELDLRSLKSLHLEKLQGKRVGQSSLRLNDQWRLIIRFEDDTEGRTIVVIEIADYH